MDTHSRSLMKTVSWRLTATVITTGVTYLLTGRADLALTVGVADTVSKFVIYYIHERVWTRVRYGVSRTPEYEI